MASYDVSRFASRTYNARNERSPSPYTMNPNMYTIERLEDNLQHTVNLSAVCKDNVAYYSEPSHGMVSPIFSWRQNTPELCSYDFAWGKQQTSRMTSPLSSHADCSLVEDNSHVLSPYIPSTFEPADYTNPGSFPPSPQESWIPIEDFAFNENHYEYPIPYSSGGSTALFNITPYPKSQQNLHLGVTLPSQDIPLFNEEISIRKRKRSPIEIYPKDAGSPQYQVVEDDEDAGSDYTPQSNKKSKSRKPPKAARGRGKKSCLQYSSPSQVTEKTKLDQYIMEKASQGSISCPQCDEQAPNKTALIRHVATAHARSFTCIFSIYGCTSTFGSKNEWKRHIATKHLRTAYWRCHLGRCAPMNPDDQPKDFNRKDLFMQHIRRMHTPSHARDKKEMNESVDDIARSCYYHVRDPPPRSICGYCRAVGKKEEFSGPNAWEYRMEHIGKHLESMDVENKLCAVDTVLEAWLMKEGLIVKDGRGNLTLGSLLEDTKGKR